MLDLSRRGFLGLLAGVSVIPFVMASFSPGKIGRWRGVEFKKMKRGKAQRAALAEFDRRVIGSHKEASRKWSDEIGVV